MHKVRIIYIFSWLLFLIVAAQAQASFDTSTAKVTVSQNSHKIWQLMVDDQPYVIKGFVYSPAKIGEDPSQATLRDWMLYDDDQDGRNDTAYQSWIDTNKNNKQDADEPSVGDFQILKNGGVNTIRLYHIASDHPIIGDLYQQNPGMQRQYAHAPNKELLRSLYHDYGIRVIIGNFTGSWTIGSGASWEQGTDYANPEHRANIKKSVKAMVLDHKDEPYVLFWLLGNENNIADWSKCNAKSESIAYAQLVGELVDMIHQLDPNHPVAVSEGDSFNTLKLYAKYAPNIDILAYNTYRRGTHLQKLFQDIRSIFDRPVYISENGLFAFQQPNGDNEAIQKDFLANNWSVIDENLNGNAIGVTFFDWLDRWYMDGAPHTQNPGIRSWPSAPDGFRHEEYFGVMSMGDGSDWLLRRPRAAFSHISNQWNKQ